jgi:hypothetical protein
VVVIATAAAAHFGKPLEKRHEASSASVQYSLNIRCVI